MLKFQSNYITTIENLEDFILTIFVLIDDLYQEHVPSSISQRRQIQTAKLSDSEIITIAICGETMGIDSEQAWFSFVKKNLRFLFPNIGSRSRFNRTRRALCSTTELVREKLLALCSVFDSSYAIVDSFPLPVCKFGRAHFCRSFRGFGADYGYCPSKKETYFGYKVHVLITLQGFITQFEVTPASIDDREGLRDLSQVCSHSVLLADKGYVSQCLTEELEQQGICLLPLKRSNSKENYSKSLRSMIFRQRRKIETIFSQLCEQLKIERVLAKSYAGLLTRLVNKILAHNLCMVCNLLLGKTFEITQIKHLLF